MDGAETDTGWTFDGFSRTTGTTITPYFNAYVLENRQYLGYDEALKLGPYNFGFPESPNFVEHFPFQDGLLISYWDSSFHDNNVGDHPGEGLILPVDSHPDDRYVERRRYADAPAHQLVRLDVHDHEDRCDHPPQPRYGAATTIASKPGRERVRRQQELLGVGTSIGCSGQRPLPG